MQLKVIPWYSEGLRFTCTQCGNCCTGAPGFVWISEVEIERLAAHMGISAKHVVERYCRKSGGKISLKEHRNERGEYDCIFLKEEKVAGKEGANTRRICSVYEARPLQCRTWPFWEGNLVSPAAWKRAGVRCHGIDHGKHKFTPKQIEALRDAEDWPSPAKPGRGS